METLLINAYTIFNLVLKNAFGVLYFFIPFLILFFAFFVLKTAWIRYIKSRFLVKTEYTLLEIKLPKEIKKTPLAMELFLTAIHQGGREATWYDRLFLGKTRPFFSLEMASFQGEVKFFIRTEKFFKNLVEAQIYAQYPDVEIYEVDDYTRMFAYDKSKYELWGTEFALSKPDPYPIKTYVDYGLHREGVKDEEKTDPMTSVIEFLGSLTAGQYAWIQIIVRAHKKDKKEDIDFLEKLKKLKTYESIDWTKEGKDEIEDLLKKIKAPDDEGGFRFPTKGETDVINAVERNIGKLGFECAIRGLHFAERDKFNAVNTMGMLGSFRQYNTANLNEFKPVSAHTTSVDYPWQDFKGYRVNKKKANIFSSYVQRSAFYPSAGPGVLPLFPGEDTHTFVLSTEELATIYHFPGGVAQTPTFSKIASRKVEPPSNLPL